MGNCQQTNQPGCCSSPKAPGEEDPPKNEPDALLQGLQSALKDIEELEEPKHSRLEDSQTEEERKKVHGPQEKSAVATKTDTHNGKTLVQYENGGVYEGRPFCDCR